MSDIIKLLPDSVANQIAAGEVIQRPASVVKELTENAVDSGATEISVVIRDSGRTLVQVIDNGSGMSETDARLAFERHATSKISSADDLFSITTKGFRGEALASVAAVSMTELRTRREEDEAGTLVEINNSRVIKQEPCSCAAGSVFSVKNLFYNVPARRKFLKSDNTEFRHIITEFQRVTLAHPEIKFTLIHNDQEIYRLPAGSHRQRIVSLFGKHYNQNLVTVETNTTIVSISGFAGKPENARRSAGEQFFFVNNRFIRHPYLHRAVLEAYQGILPPDTVPAYFLYMTADPSAIDVNIHPTKTEIKFEDERSVWQIMLASVREALGRFNVVPSLDFGPEGAVEIPVITGNTPAPPPPHIEVDHSFNPFDGNEYQRPETKWKNEGEHTPPHGWESLFTITARSEQGAGNDSPTGQRRFFQVKNRYIMCPVISGIMMIDQRRAHERVLYEKYLASLGDGPRPAQVSLFPVEAELNAGDIVILREIGDQLKTLGFEVKAGNDNMVTITGHPADSRNASPLAMLETLIAEFKHTMSDPSIGARERVALSMAKASAIPYGMPLTHTEMEELFDMLFACSMPNYSPTGKTVMNIITLEELDRRFS
ncbi:MAG: DNA mismatch repair endonuclease MutL [Marinilabiliales bacterium]|nr:DNA mismatch repair endonuclease MutL [Marinilabiliales bacterium]